MKINFDSTINDFDGEPVEIPAVVEGGREIKAAHTLKLKTVAVNALMANHIDERPEGDEKARRFALALRVHAGGEVELSPEEAALIKRLIGKAYDPLTVGRAYEILNG